VTGLLRFLLAGLILAPEPSPSRSPEVSLAPGLSRSPIPSGQERGTLTDFDFLASGYVTTSKDGRVVFVRPGEPAVELVRIPVEDEVDLGLIGLEVAADVEETGLVYTAYTYAEGDSTFGRVSSWVLDDVGDPTALSDEKPIVDGVPVDHPFHAVNTVAEGRDGSLFVSVGDGGTPAEIDPLALRAQDLDSPNGKILRVLPDGRGHPENPWYEPDAPRSWRSRAWAIGFRNPFRFSVRPGTETLLVGDVGWKEWEEIDLVRAGDNMGWPCWEGPQRTPGYRRLPACRSLYGREDVRAPAFAYRHGPSVGPGSITGGVVVSGLGLPPYLRDRYVLGDFAQGELRSLNVRSLEAGQPQRRAVAGNIGLPVRIREGPEGGLYVADLLSAQIWRFGGPRTDRGPWWLVGVLALAGMGGALVAVGHRTRIANGRTKTVGRTVGSMLLVGTAGAVAMFIVGGVIGTEAWYPTDVWFQADIPRVIGQMTGFDLTRARLHPVFPLVAYPGVAGLQALGAGEVTAIRLFTAFGAGVWLAALFAALRAIGCRTTDAVVFTALGAVSGASLLVVPVPESFALGGASILAVIVLVAVARRRPVSPIAEVGASVASFGFTLTNGMAAVAAALVRRPWARSMAVLVAAVAIVAAMIVAMGALFPSFRGVPSLDVERRFILHPAAGGPVHSAAAALSHGMIVPEIREVTAPSGVRALSVQRSWPGTGTPVAPVGVAAWAGLLGLGVWALARGPGPGVVRAALALTVAGQVGLHLLYGEEVFLFSPHVIPLLILVTALGTLTPHRRWTLVLAAVLLVAAAVNNLTQLSAALEML
jgi:glucose/arabinose dehydrogenase